MSTHDAAGTSTRALMAVPDPEADHEPTGAPAAELAESEPVEDGPAPVTDRGSDDVPAIGAETAPISIGEHASAWASDLRTDWTPPDLWTRGRPPLRDTWLWAVHGEHLPDHVQMGTGCQAAAWVLLPFRALFLSLDWIFERISRVLAAAVLLFAVLQLIHPMF